MITWSLNLPPKIQKLADQFHGLTAWIHLPQLHVSAAMWFCSVLTIASYPTLIAFKKQTMVQAQFCWFAQILLIGWFFLLLPWVSRLCNYMVSVSTWYTVRSLHSMSNYKKKKDWTLYSVSVSDFLPNSICSVQLDRMSIKNRLRMYFRLNSERRRSTPGGFTALATMVTMSSVISE